MPQQIRRDGYGRKSANPSENPQLRPQAGQQRSDGTLFTRSASFMQDGQNHIPKAQSYVSASNAHNVSAIGPMLAEDCRYVSSGVGDHEGKDAILAMMQAFFSSNPDVHWEASDYRSETSDCVVFDFAISFGGTTARGVERIRFSESGKIASIEVAR